MRRIAAILTVLATAATLFAFGSAAGGEEGTYEVRAIFDNGGFLVPGEEVRIAGAKVGAITEVGVTGVEEAAHADGSPDPGKAVVVMRIDDAAFQDFREDAECFIRPQSLLGEKFVECRVTQPRAAGTEPPPAFEPIPDGEAGEGQYLLPVESNGKAIDIDLVNNIMREPYPDRFRLILNDLGAALAARGDDLDAVIRRANPALERTDEVLNILAKQNRKLESLARDGDQVLQPLAAKRDNLGSFINEAAVTAEATAERRADLEAQIQKLPAFLRELRLTMLALDDFNEESTPVISDLGDAGPDLTRINTALGPFSEGGTVSLKSLGRAAEDAGPDLVASQPVLRDVADLAAATKPVMRTLSTLLSSLRTRGGYESLNRLLYNLAGAMNAYDSYGHFLRALLPLNNCVDYETVSHEAGCNSNWEAVATAKRFRVDPYPLAVDDGLRDRDRREAARREAARPKGPAGDAPDEVPFESSNPEEEPPADTGEQETSTFRGSRLLLDYLLGPTDETGQPKRTRR